MLTITARNVNDAYHDGLWKMKSMGEGADSRNGGVLRLNYPVATTYTHPTERMLFDAKRDANPFFHIFEAIWMLAGRNDVEFVRRFNSNIGQFSDDSVTFHGAYGFRWREHFGEDQLVWVIEHLRKNYTSRRAVLQMYDPVVDQWQKDAEAPLDIPCNTAAYFGLRHGKLNMTVTNRSNDMVWGCYGANAVHFSMLQEFIACALGVKVGRYTQFSNDLHIYERHFPLMENIADPTYYGPLWYHIPLTSQDKWGSDLVQFEEWCRWPEGEYDAPYINRVLNPMLRAWYAYKGKNKEVALGHVQEIGDEAVCYACKQWLLRRTWK